MSEVVASYASAERAAEAARQLRLAGFPAERVRVINEEQGLLASLVPPHERERPAQVEVDAGGRLLEAAAILYRYGGRAGADPELASAPDGRDGAAGETVELVAEELVPRVSAVPVGEVVVRKKVVVERRTLEVDVRREEVVVERLPIVGGEAGDGAPAAEGAHPLGADEEIVRIPVYEERVVITKEPYLTGHVVVRKRRVTEMRPISENVRREVPVVTKRGRAKVEDRTPAVR